MAVFNNLIENIMIEGKTLELMQPLYINKIYRHFKHGDLYYTLDIVRNCRLEESDPEFLQVEYVQLKSGKKYVRPIIEFTSLIESNKYPKVSDLCNEAEYRNQDYRFELMLPNDSYILIERYIQLSNVDNIPNEYKTIYSNEYLGNMYKHYHLIDSGTMNMNYTDARLSIYNNKGATFITRPEWLGVHFISKHGDYCVLVANGEVIIKPEFIGNKECNDWIKVKMHRFALEKLKRMNLI